MKKAGVITATALLCATYLSIALVDLGLDKFQYILAGGKKFATFPDFSSQIGIGGSYLGLAVLYLVWFFSEDRRSTNLTFGEILKKTAVFWLIAWVAYPLGNDVYLYLHSGLMNLSGVNPFIVRAGSFLSELSPFVDWGQTSTYGPVSQFLFTVSAAMLSVHPILAIYVFKVFCLILHLLNGYLIWQSPIESGNLQFSRDKIAIAYLVNPLLLMEQVGSGHIDVLVSTSAIVLVASLARRHYWLSVVALWGGFLSKTIPLIWVPLVAIFLIRQRQWNLLLNAILGSLGVILVLSASELPGLAAWSSLLNPGVAGQFQASLHAIARFGLDLVRIFVPGSIGMSQQQIILLMLTRLTLLWFAGFYALTAWRAFRQRSYLDRDLVEDIGWVTLVLLLFATPWLMPWYASIVLTIAALIPRARLFGLTSLAFGLSSSAQYLLQGHSSLKGLVSIGIPLLVLLVGTRILSRNPIEGINLPRSQEQFLLGDGQKSEEKESGVAGQRPA